MDEYKRLQAAYEEELFCVRQTRNSHFGEMMRAIKQVDALQAECEELRKNVERLQTRIEVIRQLYPGAPSDTELDIAINAALQRNSSSNPEEHTPST